ncbi:MAG: tRNA pseudouridine(38-40) synthase TruA [Thermoanaerobacteraceae bacterium]|nr:tRNA pseudouridine(38-40) synthase TruA [Thermoanaerobacteraceae bacterium]
MQKIKLVVQYDGTEFNGWQIQSKQSQSRTVQYELERALKALTGEAIRVEAAGRTDAGVHARGQVVSFATTSLVPVDRYPVALNSLLPEDIVVVSSEAVDEGFHARYWAKKKTYVYRIINRPFPDVFWRRYAYHIRSPLDVARMQEAACHFEGEHDFRSFCASGSSVKNYVRRVEECMVQRQGDLIALSITGDGFLYNMVRIIAGTLIEVGLGKRSAAEIPEIIEARDRKTAGHTAPAHGLTLEKVIY